MENNLFSGNYDVIADLNNDGIVQQDEIVGMDDQYAAGFKIVENVCDLNYDGIIIHDYNSLMTAYKCFLGIEKNCDEIKYQKWKNLKKEYECFTNSNSK